MKITKETLDKLRLSQQKSHYGSPAKAMFVSGVFNSDNWNGGDGLVRQYFYDKVRHDTLVTDIDFTYNERHYWGDIIITHTFYEDQSYVTITFAGTIENMISEILENYEHVVFLTWYKNRGRTESVKFDGRLMTEEEYLFVLNALQETGFEFDIR